MENLLDFSTIETPVTKENLFDFLNVKEYPAKKGYHGWKKETILPITAGQYKGRHLQIHTMKTSSGLIYCTAQVVTLTNGGYQFTMFQDPSFTLFSEKKTATEKGIIAVHAQGMEILIQRFEKNDWACGRNNEVINW